MARFHAVKWELVGRNVAKRVTLPRIGRYEAQTLTVEQATELLEVARGSRVEAVLLVALTTGMRRGELLALRWGDIDFEKGVLHVRRSSLSLHFLVEPPQAAKSSYKESSWTPDWNCS